MAFILKDRVKESTTTTGTGNISLGGALATFETFQSYLSNGDTTFYAIAHTSSGVDEWEVGLGTWNTGNTLSRTTVLAGSNGTSAVTFSAGTKDVFMTYPASKAIVSGEDAAFANITVTGTVDGRDIAADGTKLDGVEASADVTDAVTVAAAGALMRSGGTMTGNLILNTDPNAALGAATKQYVDTIASAGIHYHAPVRVEHPSNLNATYNNGSSGVGATLTNAGTNAALVIDSVNMVLNDRVLVANQTDQTQNGVYTVTTVGNGSTAWVLTRSTDTDTAAPSDPDAFGKGDAFFIKEGSTNAGHLDVLSTAGTIVFGTTNIVFSEVAETTVYSGGTGITLTGTTFSIGQDVATSANVTFNQVTAAIIGNVTGNLTGDVTGNADTATALETARTIQLSGDVTGSASFDGSANINITAAVQDDSHAHVISNVDGLQSALDAKVPTSRTITAGNGLTGGGDLSANRTLTVGGGTGITVNANDIAIDSSYTGFDSRYVNVAGDTMTAPLTIDTNTSGMLKLSATNGSPWAIDLQRDDVTNSRAYNAGGFWSFEHEPRYYNGGSHQKLFHDGYHPNADKWTTSRTLSLTGDVTGSVSWDGSANASLAATVANDSHSHSNYITSNANDTSSGTIAFGRGGLDPDSYASYSGGFGSIADGSGWSASGLFVHGGSTGRAAAIAAGSGNIYFGTQDGTTANSMATWLRVTQSSKVADFTSAPTVGGGAIWYSGNDGSGSGLDADTVDGVQASGFVRGDGTNQSAITIRVDNTDFIVQDQGDSITNFIWRDHSANKLYLGTGNAVITARSTINANSNNITNVNQLNGGTPWTSANDGSGSGLDADLLDGVQGSSFLRSDISDVYAGRVLEFGIAGNGSNTNGAFLTIEGNTDTSGEGSGRIMFREHNSTTASADSYGMSLGYRGGATSVTTAMGNSWTGLTQIGNGEWGMWGHNNNATGALIAHGPRSGAYTDFTGLKVGGNNVFHDGYHPNADTLTTARTINGVSFNGSANITVADSTKLPLAGGTMTGTLTGRDIQPAAGYHLRRLNHHSGHLEGSYNNVGSNAAKTNPIYSIGSNYNPNDDTLANFYGIGFSKNTASFMTGALDAGNSSGWGLYVASDGDARIFLNGSHGIINSTGEHYVNSQRVFHDGYHPNADKWTTARTLSLSGDASGSVSWDGSANATLSVTVANDSHTHDGRYYTESEADSRFVNVTGDTITGRLKINSAGSLFLETSSAGGYIPRPKGGHFVTGTSQYTGAIKIRMPAHGSADMISFHVDIFDYSTGESLTMFIAGYLYQVTGQNEWVNLEVITLTGNTSKDYTVRFGGDGSRNCVWIGETNSIWSYPQILVRDVQVGYSADVDLWDDDWAISFVTSFATVDETVSNNLPLAKSASSWTTARTLSLSGDASGSVSWDGSANATLSVTVADDSHNHTISNIDNLSVGSLTGMRLTTTSGYIEFGPANTSWAHIYTDRPNFYFNKELYVNNMRVYNTGYHPNADAWTSSRTLSLTGAVTGSVSWDGSGNASLSTSFNDNGPNYIDVATGNYGTVKVDDDRGVSWAGYAIRDDWVLMADGAAERLRPIQRHR